MSILVDWAIPSLFRLVDFFSFSRVAEFCQSPELQLSDSLFSYPQFLSDLFERAGLGTLPESKTQNDDLLLAFIERVKDLANLVGSRLLIDFDGQVIRTGILSALEDLFGAGSKAFPMLEFIWN